MNSVPCTNHIHTQKSISNLLAKWISYDVLNALCHTIQLNVWCILSLSTAPRARIHISFRSLTSLSECAWVLFHHLNYVRIKCAHTTSKVFSLSHSNYRSSIVSTLNVMAKEVAATMLTRKEQDGSHKM